MTRLEELLGSQQRALCERLAGRWSQPPRGEGVINALGFFLVPATLLLARADSSRPAWDVLLLAFVGGAVLGVLPTRLLANRRERLVALLYGELSRREGEGGDASRQA